MKELISIILPIYNGEETLERCLKSLICQTYTNIEIILVNDGSKDSSEDIIERYAREDKRIKAFHKENGGESSARNLGLDNAKGEWITFCDQDDYVDDNYIQSFLDKEALRKDTLYITGEKEGFSTKDLKPQRNIYIGGNKSQELLDLLQANGTTWGKLFAKDIIDKLHLRYNDEVFYGGDKLFTMLYLSAVDRVVYNEKEFPYNYVNDFCPSKFIKSFEREKINFDSIVSELRKYHPEYCNASWFISNYKLLLYSVFCQKQGKQQKFSYLQQVREHPEAEGILDFMIKQGGRLSFLWQWLQRREYNKVYFVCNLSVPIVVRLFSSRIFLPIKRLLKNIG